LLSVINAAIVSPILESNPYSNVDFGSSNTPSRLMNSCTTIFPMLLSFVGVSGK